MKKIIVVILFLVSKFSFAQEIANTKNKKAAEAYEKAMLQLRDGLTRDAIPLLGKAIEYDPNFMDAYLSLAGVYGELKNYPKSVELFEKAKSFDTAYFKYYNLPYSMNLAGLGKFDEALNAVNAFLAIPNLNDKSVKSAEYRKHCYEFAINYAATHSSNYVFTPLNLGDSINSIQSEYFPSFTIDDSTLVFTRRGEGLREDFMMSNLLSKNYTKATEINGTLNEEPQKGAINISQDGEW